MRTGPGLSAQRQARQPAASQRGGGATNLKAWWILWAQLAGVLALLLSIAASGSSRPAYAAGPEVRITPASVAVAPGGSVTVDVEVEAPAAGLGAWTIDVFYTPSVVAATNCEQLQGSLCNRSFTNKVRVVGSNPTGLSGATALARITFQAVGAAGSSSLLDVTVVTFTDPEGSSVSRTVTDGQVIVDPQADLAVTLADAPDPIVATRLLTYTAIVTNNGPQTATNVTLTDIIPAGLRLESVSVTPTGLSCLGTSTVTCDLGTMSSGTFATVTIRGWPLSAGTLPHTVAVSAMETDPIPGNNTATASTTVTAVPPGEPEWIELSATDGPPAPRGDGSNQAIGYDPATNRLVFFAGNRINGTQHLNDTWVLVGADGTAGTPQWLPLPTQNTPAGRDLHAGAYDVRNNVLIVYGGCLGGCTPIDTQVYALDHANGLGGTPTWRVVPTTGGPPTMRVGTTATYDAANNRLMVFGGDNGFGGRLNNIWGLSNANGLSGPSQWRELTPAAPSPVGRTSHTAEYDYTNNRLIIFGGNTGGGVQTNDVWVLTCANGLPVDCTPAWSQLNPTGTPPSARSGHLSLYDQATNRMMIFGGSSGATVLNDMWVLRCANGLGCTPAWSQLDPYGLPIPGRSGTLAVHNSVTNRLVVWSGTGQTDLLADLWVLENANGVPGGVGANLEVTSTVAPQIVTIGNRVTYTITVTNHGSVKATGVKVVDLLPDYMDLISSATDTIEPEVRVPAITCAVLDARTVSCNIGDLPAGESVDIVITELAKKGNTFTDTAGGPKTSSVYLSANETDLLPSDNSETSPQDGVGDVNDSDAVDAVDALCLERGVAGLPGTGACPVPLPFPDVNLDSDVTSVDALCVRRVVAGLPPTTACPLLPLESAGGGSLVIGGSTAQVTAGGGRREPGGATNRGPGGPGAPGNADATIALEGATTIAPAGEATVRVTTRGAVRPGAWTVDVNYDSAVLTALRCTSATGLCNATFRQGVVRLTGSAVEGLMDGAVLGEISFRATGATGSASALSPRVVTLAGTAGAPLRAATTDGRLAVSPSPRSGGTGTATPAPPQTPTATPRGGRTPTATATPAPRGGGTPAPAATPTASPCPRGGCGAAGR
jgi:uncharacterized repeat protein (TIGR01451 family)